MGDGVGKYEGPITLADYQNHIQSRSDRWMNLVSREKSALIQTWWLYVHTRNNAKSLLETAQANIKPVYVLQINTEEFDELFRKHLNLIDASLDQMEVWLSDTSSPGSEPS